MSLRSWADVAELDVKKRAAIALERIAKQLARINKREDEWQHQRKEEAKP